MAQQQRSSKDKEHLETTSKPCKTWQAYRISMA